jgi:hypothetical protein
VGSGVLSTAADSSRAVRQRSSTASSRSTLYFPRETRLFGFPLEVPLALVALAPGAGSVFPATVVSSSISESGESTTHFHTFPFPLLWSPLLWSPLPFQIPGKVFIVPSSSILLLSLFSLLLLLFLSPTPGANSKLHVDCPYLLQHLNVCIPDGATSILAPQQSTCEVPPEVYIYTQCCTYSIPYISHIIGM